MAIEMVYLAVATLLAPVFAEMAKIRAKVGKAFQYIAAGGVFFLTSAAFTVVNLDAYVQGLSTGISTIAGVIGVIAVLIGTIMAAIELMK